MVVFPGQYSNISWAILQCSITQDCWSIVHETRQLERKIESVFEREGESKRGRERERETAGAKNVSEERRGRARLVALLPTYQSRPKRCIHLFDFVCVYLRTVAFLVRGRRMSARNDVAAPDSLRFSRSLTVRDQSPSLVATSAGQGSKAARQHDNAKNSNGGTARTENVGEE